MQRRIGPPSAGTQSSSNRRNKKNDSISSITSDKRDNDKEDDESKISSLESSKNTRDKKRRGYLFQCRCSGRSRAIIIIIGSFILASVGMLIGAGISEFVRGQKRFTGAKHKQNSLEPVSRRSTTRMQQSAQRKKLFQDTAPGVRTKDVLSQIQQSDVVSSVVQKSLGKLYDPPKAIVSRNKQESISPRHACLQAIRQRHGKAFIPLLQQASDILLVDPAYHANVGDNMIAVAEQLLVQRTLGPLAAKVSYQECSYIQASTYAPPCHEVIPLPQQLNHVEQQDSATRRPHRLALWHGGGNFGDLWPHIQELRTQSIPLLLRNNYTVLGMPQSLYFGSSQRQVKNAQQFQTLVVDDPAHGRNTIKQQLIWSWRERESYEKARKLYPYATHLLVPDIAFQLGPYDAASMENKYDSTRNQVDILLLLRSDHESIYSSQRSRHDISLLLNQVQKERRYSFSIVDWPDRLDWFALNDREEVKDHESDNFLFTESAIRLLNLGRVVVCDRLHAAILAYLSGLSFVYLDQVSGKISKTWAVAMDSHEACRQGGWMRNSSGPTAAFFTPFLSPPWWARANNLTHGLFLAVQMLHATENNRHGSEREDRESQRRRRRQQQRRQPQDPFP